MKIENIIDKILSIFDKLVPNGNKKLLAKVELVRLLSDLKQPITLSILTVMFYLVFQLKAIFMDSYLLSDWFYIDLTFLILSLSFYFGVPFKTLLKAIKDFSKQKKEK